MAKKARKTASRAKSKGRKAAPKQAAAPHPDDHIDGCLCDVTVPEHLYTRDEDLPPARGGVARQ